MTIDEYKLILKKFGLDTIGKDVKKLAVDFDGIGKNIEKINKSINTMLSTQEDHTNKLNMILKSQGFMSGLIGAAGDAISGIQRHLHIDPPLDMRKREEMLQKAIKIDPVKYY